MKRRALFRTYCSPLILPVLMFWHTGALATDELRQIRQAIVEKGAQWTASENWITRLASDERQRLFGVVSRAPDLSRARLLPVPLIANLPSKFDWRNNNGNWVTTPKNQGMCGSCWDFAAVGQTEAWWKIHNANADSMIDLSEQFILSCGNAGTCDGGDIGAALEAVRTTGIPPETCFPYRATHLVPCSAVCSDWQDQAVRIPGYGYVTLAEPVIDIIKSSVYRHPVSSFMEVYEDFFSYSTGIYRHVWGNMAGGHFVLIVGWNDEEQSWICKNSWGTDWGETADFVPHTPGAGNGGYFRIKYEQCGIGCWAITVWDEIAADSALAVSPELIDCVLRIGDTLSLPVTLSNGGSGLVEFSSVDYQSPLVARFHPSEFQAYDEQSWWCGDPQIRGYGNYWLQYLDMPVLNLSQATAPKLSFMAYWAVEAPSNVPPPFDGWDGCNVWLSTDGGKSFDVALPKSPAYNCSSLHGFGGGAFGWGMGPGIAGWGGMSNGWRPVEFDLSPYKADSVIVRFAFASDLGLCTLDDPTLYGFLIDDITVADAGMVLYENHGDADSATHVFGYAGQEKADWLTVSPDAGTIGPKASFLSNVRIDTRSLPAGRYCGVVFISSNDTTNVYLGGPSGRIQINLELRDTTAAPVQNQIAAIPGSWTLAQNYPNPFNPSTTIGYGLPQRATVSLVVFNTLGELVASLVQGEQDAGYHDVRFDGSGLSSGVYFYRIQAGRFTETRRLLLLH